MQIFTQPTAVHLGVLILMISYAIFGGLIFATLEQNQSEILTQDLKINVGHCLELEILNSTNISIPFVLETCILPYFAHPNWTTFNSILFAFTVMTTAAFGNFAPHTEEGRAFFVLFAIIGIPLCMLVLADIGAFLKEFACKIFRWCKCKRGKETENSPVEFSGVFVLIFFVIYTILGTFLLFYLNNWNGTFVSTLFFTFSPLIGADFSPMSAGKLMFIPMKLIYASIGLAIATIAIDAGSDSLKKLHHFGRKLTNAANVMIWFGPKKISVGKLLIIVCRKYGVEEEILNSLDLDQVVMEAISESQHQQPEHTQNSIKNFSSTVPNHDAQFEQRQEETHVVDIANQKENSIEQLQEDTGCPKKNSLVANRSNS